jgi:group I intron endonuclease
MTLSVNIKRVFHGCGNLGGLYTITCSVSGRFYIGSTSLFENRVRSHYYDLRRNRHVNTALQSDFNLYGVDAFVFEVVRVIPDPVARARAEEKWIREMFGDGCYNASFACGPVIYTPEMRAKMAEARKGKKHSPETRSRMRESRQARIPPETVKRLEDKRRAIDEAAIERRIAQKLACIEREATRSAAKALAEEARLAAKAERATLRETERVAKRELRLQAPPASGWKLSSDTRARMSLAKSGAPRAPWTPERKAARSALTKGRPASVPAGWKHTPETRAKMRHAILPERV